MRKALSLVFLFLLYIPLAAQEKDSISVAGSERFRWPQLILPAATMTVGAVGVANPWFESHINDRVRSWAGQIRGDRYIHADDYIQYAPAAAYMLIGLAGRRDHSLGERTLILATSWLSLGIMVNSIKYTVRDLRPDESARNSFPSGHTATAFMGAELIRKEYGPWWGAGAYVVAAGTGFLRIYNNRHWFNDILGGAAVGILSANIGYWLLPYERRLFPRHEGTLSLLPSLERCGRQSTYGFSLTWVF